MAFMHGKDSYFTLDDTGDSPTDISPYIDSISGLPGAIDMAEVTTMGKEDKVVIPGTGGTVITISGPWDATFHALIGTNAQRKVARDYVYGPAGNSGVKISGSCYALGYDFPSSAGDAVRYTLALTTSDTITVGTF